MSARPSRCSEEGSVLVLALLVVLLLAGLGLSMVWVANSGQHISGKLTRRAEAMACAEAGVARARALLKATSDWKPLLVGCSATRDDKGGRGVILCEGGTPLEEISVVPPSSETAKAVSALTQSRYTIWVRNDEAEWAHCATGSKDCDGDGSAETDEWRRTTDRDGRIVVEVIGSARDGFSRVALHVVIARDPDEVGKRPVYAQEGGGPLGANGANASLR